MMEEQTNEKLCYNCNTALSEGAKYCSNCGQKHTTGKVPIYEFVYDFFANVFNLDGRLPKTLVNLLFFPGKLTIEFFKGKHQSYLKPAQVFVFMTFLCFTIIAFQANQLNTKFEKKGDGNSLITNIRYNEGKNHLHRLMARDTAKQEVDSLLTIAKNKIKQAEVSAVLDNTFSDWLKENPELKDSIGFPLSMSPNIKGLQQTIKMSKQDIILCSEKELLKKYPIEGFVKQVFFIQTLKSFRQQDALLEHLLGHLSWTFFLLVPFFALILKMVYIRNKQFYVEHLVFTFHFHTFIFTIISFLLLLKGYLSSTVSTALVAYIGIYLFWSMKKFYGQSFFKTLFKYILLSISYFILFIFTLVIVLMVSFVLF